MATTSKDYAAKDTGALAGQYADNAALASPGDPLATSDVDRRRAMQGLTGDPNFALTFSSDRVLVAKSGDLASSRGHYSITMTDKATSKPVTSSGSYLTVYKRGSRRLESGGGLHHAGTCPGPCTGSSK